MAGGRKKGSISIKDKLWDGLTKKQYEWVNEYLKTGNGVQAALKVYETTDYNTANNISVENLQNPTILNYIDMNMSVNALNDEWIIKEIMKDINSGDKQLRLNGLNLLSKIRAMVTEKRITIDEQKKEIGKITYDSYAETQGNTSVTSSDVAQYPMRDISKEKDITPVA